MTCLHGRHLAGIQDAANSPPLVKDQSANVRSFELSKETLKPHRVLSGLSAAGSRVFQLKPA
ncbi:hypothetical protein BJP08_10550 [Corynebacterium sp. NML140438]|nr:hypothetical protein BJP08_10550 [Corynebacterium sp. NML140438]